MWHPILFEYLLKILVNVIRFCNISFKFVIKVMPLVKCLALPAGPKQRWEGWSNYVECPLPRALLFNPENHRFALPIALEIKINKLIKIDHELQFFFLWIYLKRRFAFAFFFLEYGSTYQWFSSTLSLLP